MTRGKYAAKANGQRAEAAANTVAALRNQIEQMRRERTAEVADLKARIGSLEGQLVREVRKLAAAEVERVRTEAHLAIESERAQAKDRLAKIAALIRGNKRGAALHADLADLLGVRVGDLVLAREDGTLPSRELRRHTSSDSRRAAAHASPWWAPWPGEGEDYVVPR